MRRQNLFTSALCAILWWGLVLTLFPTEIRFLAEDIEKTIGLIGFLLIPISAYLVLLCFYVFRNRKAYHYRHRELLLNHIETCGEVSSILGLLQTILSMLESNGSGTPDMTRFLASLNSTFLGSGLYVLTIAFRAFMTRPVLTPVIKKTQPNRGRQRHG